MLTLFLSHLCLLHKECITRLNRSMYVVFQGLALWLDCGFGFLCYPGLFSWSHFHHQVCPLSAWGSLDRYGLSLTRFTIYNEWCYFCCCEVCGDGCVYIHACTYTPVQVHAFFFCCWSFFLFDGCGFVGSKHIYKLILLEKLFLCIKNGMQFFFPLSHGEFHSLIF